MFTADLLIGNTSSLKIEIAIQSGLLFCGALLFTSFFIGLVFLKSKDRIYLYYFLFLFFSLIEAIIFLRHTELMGSLFQLSDKSSARYLELFTLFAYAAYCLFTIRLLDIKRQNIKLYYWILFMAYSGALYAVVYHFYSPSSAGGRELAFILSRLVILFMSIVAILWIFFKHLQSPFKGYFLLGSAFYFLGTLLAVLRGTIPTLPIRTLYQFDSETYFQWGILFQIICFSLALAYRLYISYEQKRKDQEKINAIAIYEKERAQAEMIATRSQLNPHFLFNSLNAINLLIQKGESKKAGQYLIILSRFFRMVLELPKSQSIPLSEEIKLLQYYLRLEERRFDNNFHYSIDTFSREELKKIQIPPLILQPFVENAIWHGLLPSEKKVKKLLIKTTREKNKIYIIIEDNGVGRRTFSASQDKNMFSHKKSVGMKLTKDRIKHFNQSYTSKISFEIIDKKNSSDERLGTKVILTINY